MTDELHDYQIVARDFLRGRDRAAIWLDMGLGKTAATLSALEDRHLPAVVIAPKRVAESVWDTEVARWRPDLTVAVAAGRPDHRRAVLTSGADVIALGRDNLKDLLSVAPGRAEPFRTVIIDEASGFKTPSSQRVKMMRKFLKEHAPAHVWELTGTPAPNGLLDVWSQIVLLDGGERLGRNLTTYRGRYFRPGRQLPSGVVTEWIIREGADEKIHDLLSDIALSMSTEGRIDLPPVTHNTITVDLPPNARTAYKRFKRTLVADLDVLGGEIHTAANAAVLSGKLSQMSAGFVYHDDADLRGGSYDVVHTEKINALREVIDGTGSPVLVFHRFKAEREMILSGIDGARYLDGPDVIAAWNRGEVPVLVAHPASAGHGLNLQHGGHTIVWTTLPWSLEEYAQANKRLARQGQKHPVVIHTINARHTIDPMISETLDGKRDVQNALLDHLDSPI